MERLYSFLLTVLFSLPLFAVDFTDGDFKFSTNADGTTCTVTGTTLTSGDLIIPSEATYSNKILTVTDIGEKAFYQNGCKSLKLPDKLKTIGNYAFYMCTNFKCELVLPDGISSIGNWAFFECKGFSGDLTIPSSVTIIGDNAFTACTGLSGTLYFNAINCADCAGFSENFFGETRFNNIVIGDQVLHIPAYFMHLNKGITGSLTIGTGVKTIGRQAFDGCSGLTGTLNYNATECEDFDIYTDFVEGANFSKIVIGDNVKKVPAYFLWGLYSGNHSGTLSIGQAVESIGAYAFHECSGLTGDLIISDNVISIGENSFNGCSGFNGNLYIGSNVESIGAYAFRDCSGFTGDLVIPNRVKSIGTFAFDACSGFDGQLRIGIGLRDLEEYAFNGCSGLKGDLVIPEGITEIEQDAFQGCTGLAGILILPPTLTGLGTYQFIYGNYSKVVSMNPTPPAYIGKVGYHAFDVDNYKATLYVPDESIDEYKASDIWSPFYAILPLSELKIPATSVSVSNTNLELLVGESATLTATVNPYYATDRSVAWSSANNSVATVDSDGKVTALKAGSVVITATTANSLTSNCVVNVVAKRVDATAVVLNIENAELEEGESVQLTATITPSDATDKTISWVSGNPSIAIVDTNGKVTAVKTGSVIITASTSNGLKATCIITVIPRIISPSSLTLNLETAEIEDGESVQLTATITPDNATDKSVSWSTSDASIATVDALGKVTGVKEGSVNITAKTANGLTATCKVTVKAKADSAIDGVESDGISVSAENGVIVISAPEDAVAEVFAITGVMLRSTTEHRISGLSRGVYVVRVAAKMFKVKL